LLEKFYSPQVVEYLPAHLNTACEESGAKVIVSGNIGCITHLQQDDTPVLHWIEIVDQLISQQGQSKQ
jgi:glycolate oxidase iron-sulfur subunit